jgi:hypothetical protein
VNTLLRWRWTARALMNSRAAVSGLERPFLATAPPEHLVERARQSPRCCVPLWPGAANKLSGGLQLSASSLSERGAPMRRLPRPSAGSLSICRSREVKDSTSPGSRGCLPLGRLQVERSPDPPPVADRDAVGGGVQRRMSGRNAGGRRALERSIARENTHVFFGLAQGERGARDPHCGQFAAVVCEDHVGGGLAPHPCATGMKVASPGLSPCHTRPRSSSCSFRTFLSLAGRR